MKKLLFEAISLEQEMPPHTQVIQVLIGERIPMTAMLYANGKFMTMGMAQAKEIAGVTHWLKPVDMMADRFAFEELIHRGLRYWDRIDEYPYTLLFDWFKEVVRNTPVTEEERQAYLATTGWDEDFIEAAYFESEAALQAYLYPDADTGQ